MTNQASLDDELINQAYLDAVRRWETYKLAATNFSERLAAFNDFVTECRAIRDKARITYKSFIKARDVSLGLKVVSLPPLANPAILALAIQSDGTLKGVGRNSSKETVLNWSVERQGFIPWGS